MLFRVTRAGKYPYVQIARSRRDGKAVHQETLLSLVRLNVVLRPGLHLREKLAVVDARASGQTETVALRRKGLRSAVDWDASIISLDRAHDAVCGGVAASHSAAAARTE